ncbi:MAG: hypothetical protein DMF87_15450 [Acidobacteria bacterium]|nr:MAG: hypothetical protein DMF87_15450 [Acidobacteriota bacterium]
MSKVAGEVCGIQSESARMLAATSRASAFRERRDGHLPLLDARPHDAVERLLVRSQHQMPELVRHDIAEDHRKRPRRVHPRMRQPRRYRDPRVNWQSRAHFLAMAARIMRRVSRSTRGWPSRRRRTSTSSR